MGREQIRFTSGSVTCEGIFERPEQSTHMPGIVICHPHPLYGGDMENNVVRALAAAFTAAGFAVLRFNFRGVGGSTGHYEEGIGEQEDVRAALGWLAAQPGMDVERLFLAGYSFGARVTLAVASTDPRVHGFIAVAPSTRHGDWPSLASSCGPKIFFCGDHDFHASPEALADLIQDLAEPKRLVVLPHTDHFFVDHEGMLAQSAVKLLQELSSANSCHHRASPEV
jgi:alpha/beta superfamily hydrolase